MRVAKYRLSFTVLSPDLSQSKDYETYLYLNDKEKMRVVAFDVIFLIVRALVGLDYQTYMVRGLMLSEVKDDGTAGELTQIPQAFLKAFEEEG